MSLLRTNLIQTFIKNYSYLRSFYLKIEVLVIILSLSPPLLVPIAFRSCQGTNKQTDRLRDRHHIALEKGLKMIGRFKEDVKYIV